MGIFLLVEEQEEGEEGENTCGFSEDSSEMGRLDCF